MKLKLIRAEEHLSLLDRRIEEYFNGKPLEVVKEADAEFVRFVLRIREQPAPYLGVIIGDCLHNMRSALDHLLWQFINFPLPKEIRANKLSFPIFLKEVRYREEMESNRLPRCISKEAMTLIDGLQPYHGGDQANMHALWFLHELSNRDKHKMIHTTAGAAICDEVALAGTMNPALFSGIVNPAILKDGAELFRLPLAKNATDRMNVNARFRYFVALKETDSWTDDAVTAYLDRCLNFLRSEIVPAFEPLIGK
ncbi:MAG: hypothetical protein HY651_05545 [Acidobacteria bacterium]|nr:hypothetical protein [Acidobacteriota bacterium]